MPPEPGDNSGDSWKDELPEDIRNSTLIQEAKSFEDVAKQAVDYQRLNGGSIRIPSEHASDDERSAFNLKLTELGMMPKDNFRELVRPEEADKYQYKDGVDDNLGIVQGDMDRWKIDAHKLGLSQEQFQEYAADAIGNRKSALLAQQATFDAADAALKEEWGDHAFDSKKQQAFNALKRFGGDELMARMEENPDPSMLRAFAEIGKEFEEKGLGDLDTPRVLPESRDDAETKLAEIYSNKDHPFNQRQVVGQKAYDAAAAEVMRLKNITLGLPAPRGDFMFEETP